MKKKLLSILELGYRRAQFQRRHWLSLNGEWKFSRTHIENLSDVCWAHKVQVLYPPESPLSGRPVEATSLLSRLVPKGPSGFFGMVGEANPPLGVVDYAANVWGNDQPVVTHEGGYTPFIADIMHTLKNGQQIVTVGGLIPH